MGSPTSTSPANPPSSPSANSPNFGGLIRRPRGNTLKANDRNPPSPTTASNDPLPSPPTNSTQPVGTAGGAEEGRSSYFPGLRRKGSRRLLSFGGHSNIAEASGEASGSGSGSGERNNSSAIGAGSGSPSGHHHHLFSSGRGARRSSSQPPAQQTPNHSSNSTTNTNESDMASTSSPRLTSPRTPSTHQRSHTAVHGSLSPLPAISTTQVEHSTTVNSGSGETSDRPSTGSGADSPKRTHIRLVPHLESTRSLHFEPIERALLPGSSLKIGRFTERNSNNPNSGLGPDALTSTKVAFHSKVVSRTHAEIHLISSAADGGVTFQIKDTCSSSGTFLNHIRLSGPGLESRLFSLRDGDVVQLGVDYQGGTEEQYRCVKIRVEIGRNWQKGPNTFNANALKQLRALSVTPAKTATSKAAAPAEPAEQLTDCCICLYPITVCQALFIAPCSHTTHFKCIRPMINLHYPGFNCPPLSDFCQPGRGRRDRPRTGRGRALNR
ncbi:hypothetical protein BT69DRAFT_345264 [Atractiella rhizophila]|nr:hypothetical protein BT69DRAFT_345264 [Atractiella rhizophila]